MKNRFNHILLGTALIALGTACSDKDQIINEPPVNGDLITIQVNQPTWAQTRLSYDYDDKASTMDINWSTGDAIYVVDALGQATGAAFNISSGEGGKLASFTGVKPTGYSFKVFYPYSKAYNQYKGGVYENWNNCAFNVSGQVQDGSGSTEHLSKYNFMTIGGTEINGGNLSEASLNLRHEVAILRFEIELDNTNAKPKQLQLKVRETDAHSEDKHGFVIAKKADNENYVLLQVSRTICMDLKNINTNTFVAYMAVLPGTLKGPMSVEVYYNEDGGNVINKGMSREILFPNTTWEIEAGKIYHAKLEKGFADISDRVFYTGITASNSLSTRPSYPDQYVLKTAADLKHLVEKHNQYGENGKNSVSFNLNTDIHVTANAWKPIGASSSQPFVHLLTKGLTQKPIISGKLINESYDSFGFVGNLQSPSVSGQPGILNLQITADLLNKYSATGVEVAIGSVVGQSSRFISRCSASGAILPVGDNVIKSAGGLIGTTPNNLTVTDCMNDCTIMYADYVGGLFGSRTGTSPNLNDCKGLCEYPIGNYSSKPWQ